MAMGLANLRITLTRKRHSNVALPKGRAELGKLPILIGVIGLDAKGDSGAEGSLGRNGQGG